MMGWLHCPHDVRRPAAAGKRRSQCSPRAIGLQGQYIYVDPPSRTVVVKLSYFPPGDNSALDAETRAFMSAAAAWKP